MTSLHPLLTEKPAIAPPVFVFQKDKALKVRYTKIWVGALRRMYFSFWNVMYLFITELIYFKSMVCLSIVKTRNTDLQWYFENTINIAHASLAL